MNWASGWRWKLSLDFDLQICWTSRTNTRERKRCRPKQPSSALRHNPKNLQSWLEPHLKAKGRINLALALLLAKSSGSQRRERRADAAHLHGPEEQLRGFHEQRPNEESADPDSERFR